MIETGIDKLGIVLLRYHKSSLIHSRENSVDHVLEGIFNSFATDVPLCGGPWQCLPWNNHNHVRGSDALVEVSSRMEMPCFPEDIFSEFVMVNVNGWFDEHNG